MRTEERICVQRISAPAKWKFRLTCSISVLQAQPIQLNEELSAGVSPSTHIHPTGCCTSDSTCAVTGIIEQARFIAFNGTIRSGTSITAEVVFRALYLDVDEKYFSNAKAVARVRDGRLATAVFIVGKPANYFHGISHEEGLHLLLIEFTKSLNRAGYLSSHFFAENYPNLEIPFSGVETIAVAAVLAVYD